ncbi:AraC family transcriptional regulator [Paenibacillus ginsengarvi]|uniref:AraC family transcriptional regulator n=1 Tax=Paenibacillus ginsengarvi TaxID=400777 RepID=A0A3B0CIU8_9BACL|nr:AraC family transcriptional regulator [Paenibacillus ginsengarvi]RKN85595.1 AraC family transcriptional regulator [Paenibacillus ginsengarvi]
MQLDCEVLAAGYSYHTKPFVSTQPVLPQYLIRFQSEGRCKAFIDGELRSVEAGDLMLFKPGDPYELRVEPELQPSGEMAVASGDYYFFCRGSWLDEWWEQRRRPTIVNIPLHDNVLSICRQIVLEHYRGKRKYKQIADYYMRIFCITVDREMTEHTAPGGGTRSFLAQRMRNYVEEHAPGAFKLEDVARSVGLSPSRAVHLFKTCFGQSIMQYALQIRLSIAKERMLYSPMSLEQIAELSGFSSYSYFHRMFRAHYGISPKRYQQQMLGQSFPAADADTSVRS